MRIVAAVVLVVLCAGGACAASSLYPVFKNAGFEEEGGGISSWEWYPGSAASCVIDTTNPHSGSRCLAFADPVEHPILESFGRLQQWMGLLPGMKYELSVWVRGEDVRPGIFFTDWNSFRMDIPSGTYGWKKVSKVFLARDYLSWVNMGLNVGGPAKSFAIDDISLRPVGTPFEGGGIEGHHMTPGRVDGDNKNTPISISVNSSLKAEASVEVVIKAGDKPVFRKTAPIKPGTNTIDWEWNSGELITRNHGFSLRVVDSKGKALVSASQKIEKCSTGILLAEIDAVEKRLKGEFTALYEKCRAKGVPVDYPTSTKTMLEQFIPLARSDARDDQRRAGFAVEDFNRALDYSIAEMRACLADPRLARNAVRYQTGKLEIDGLSMVGDRRDSLGNKSRGPLFFVGYGHFYQARKDIPRFPGYGVNIIQFAEFGPSAVLPSEDEVCYESINTLVQTLDEAARANVKVDVLVSPHYFPGWPSHKWPQLVSGGGGFLGYCVDLPEAKFVNEKFLRILIPLIKDKPALHSLCLTNEPSFDHTTGAPNTRPMYVSYLIQRYGDIRDLNTRYGSDYKSFDEVPMGGGLDDPQFYDWCMFNRERFADWHKWMADVIHDMAPEIPVHSKVCTIATLPSRVYSGNGVDLELMGRVSQLNGNDCCFYTGSTEGYMSHWQLQNAAYDIQRSLNRKPIFNSENHISRDFSMNYVPPEHFRTVLWQGAIHGQASTTIWIWERATSSAHTWCFYGNVMDRPGCALAVGTTCMDLNRFAEEVTALQNVKAPAAIVYSNASFMRNGEYLVAKNRVYEALNFCGVKVDFISEAQLARGDGAKYGMIILPQTTHLTRSAFRGLCALPSSTRLVALGETPAKDPQSNALPEAEVKRVRDRALAIDGDSSPRQIWPVLRRELAALRALPECSVVDAKSGEPVWGVEWLPARVGGRTVINLVNLNDKPVAVKVLRGGREVAAKDLLSLGGREGVRLLKPESPVLAEVVK